MQTIVVDASELGAVVLVEAPREIVDQRTGEVHYAGRILVPGERRPVEIRVRLAEPYHGDLGPVTVHGDPVRLTRWYRPSRSRDTLAASEVTLSADSLSQATDWPDLEGRDVPIRLPDGLRVIAGKATERGDYLATCMLPADHPFDPDGRTCEVTLPDAPGDDVHPGVVVTPFGAQVAITVPDRQDVGRFAKAQLRVRALRLEAAGGARKTRPSAPTATSVPTPEPTPA